MATLMSLPRELRDVIITLAIQTPLPPPLLPLSPDRTPMPDDVDEHVLLPPEHSTHSTAYALLLVNKELHYQTSTLLERLKDTLEYTIDVMFVNEERLAVTWLCAPPPGTKLIPSLRLNLRACGTSRDKRTVSGFADRGWGSPLGWALQGFIRYFITHGMHPVAKTEHTGPSHRTGGPSKGPKKPKKPKKLDKSMKKLNDKRIAREGQCFCDAPAYRYTIRTLHLDIATPEIAPGESFAPVHLPICEAEWPESQPRDKTYVANPHALADWVLHVGSSLPWRFFRPMRALYERVGEMNISLDGDVLRTYDFGEILERVYQGIQVGEDVCREKIIRARRKARLV